MSGIKTWEYWRRDMKILGSSNAGGKNNNSGAIVCHYAFYYDVTTPATMTSLTPTMTSLTHLL